MVFFRDTYLPHLTLFLLDVPFRDGIPLFVTACFLLFIGALKVGFKHILLICGEISG